MKRATGTNWQAQLVRLNKKRQNVGTGVYIAGLLLLLVGAYLISTAQEVEPEPNPTPEGHEQEA